MADKRDGQAQSQAQVKIGHYILGDTLGVGTFGKVKSEFRTVFADDFHGMAGNVLSSRIELKWVVGTWELFTSSAKVISSERGLWVWHHQTISLFLVFSPVCSKMSPLDLVEAVKRNVHLLTFDTSCLNIMEVDSFFYFLLILFVHETPGSCLLISKPVWCSVTSASLAFSSTSLWSCLVFHYLAFLNSIPHSWSPVFC